jgi:hypothetical protein
MTQSSVIHQTDQKVSGRVAQITIGVVNPADVSREKAGTRMSPPIGTDIHISKGVIVNKVESNGQETG